MGDWRLHAIYLILLSVRMPEEEQPTNRNFSRCLHSQSISLGSECSPVTLLLSGNFITSISVCVCVCIYIYMYIYIYIYIYRVIQNNSSDLKLA
jgi:hypothetical protein